MYVYLAWMYDGREQMDLMTIQMFLRITSIVELHRESLL